MSSSYKFKKVKNKQLRCRSIICNECDILSSEVPTRFLAILNAGLSTGLTDERVLAEVTRHGEIEKLLMLPGKSYTFLICQNVDHSQAIFLGMHNQSQIGQNGAIVFMSYFESVPSFSTPWERPPPAGLILLEEFVSHCEENALLQSINLSQNSMQDASTLKYRQVMHFGYEFMYGDNSVRPDCPLEQTIPADCDFLWQRLQQKVASQEVNMTWEVPDQLTVNVYQPGDGIPPHVDTHSAFFDPIVSLSLESDVVMDFRRGNERISLVLPRRSLLIMSGESRYDWTHGISSRAMDCLPSKSGSLTTKKRLKRTSFTFRKLRCSPCDCGFPKLCDTRQQSLCGGTHLALDHIATQLEETNVHEVYEKIADHFSETRHKAWPQVVEFIDGFECGSVLMDIGCGNGKYLYSNRDILKVGCDRSSRLLQVCISNQQNVFKCDCLCVPVRPGTVDGCINIAVIHHLATPGRRLAAIKEMARILVTGGRGLIYVWSKDQRSNAKKSSYLLQNKAINKKKATEDEQRLADAQTTKSYQTTHATKFNLPIHTNRTDFQQQDLLVPWKLKTGEVKSPTYLRYYHVFETKELEGLVAQIPEIELLKSYYDQGNHCVIFKKN